MAVCWCVDVGGEDAEDCIMCTYPQTWRTLDICYFCWHVKLITIHRNSSDISNRELWNYFWSLIFIINAGGVGQVDGNAKYGDTYEHAAEWEENVVVGINTIPQQQIRIILQLIITLRYLELQFLKQSQPQMMPKLILLVVWFEADCKYFCNMLWRDAIFEWIGVFDVHQSFIDLLPCYFGLFVSTKVRLVPNKRLVFLLILPFILLIHLIH